jgi:hypothetical protein
MDDRGVINIAASSPNFVLQSLGNPRLGCVRALGLIHELCRTHGHEHEERERIINATPADGETEAENHISLIPGLAVHSISPFCGGRWLISKRTYSSIGRSVGKRVSERRSGAPTLRSTHNGYWPLGSDRLR